MKIHFHHCECSVYAADIADISDLLQIPVNLFKSYQQKNGTDVYKYSVPDSGVNESIVIRLPESESASGKILLHGSFFNSFDNFPMHKLRDYVNQHAGNIYHLDVSYVDDEGKLDTAEIKRMSLLENYKSYLTGSVTVSRKKTSGDKIDSNNRGGVPDVHTNHALIHYGDAGSNYVKYYQQAGKPAKFELTLIDKKRIKSLLASYDPATITDFYDDVKRILITHLNFITPASKRAKRHIQVDMYREFLGTELKPIKWTDYLPEKNLSGENFDTGLSRVFAQIQNLCRRHGILEDMEPDIYRLQTKARRLFDETRIDFDEIDLTGIDFNCVDAPTIL